jgi:hypothetical protein
MFEDKIFTVSILPRSDHTTSGSDCKYASMVKQKPKRILLYVLVAFGYLILTLIFPILDPTRYLPSASRCTRMSEEKILNVARAGLTSEIDFLTRNFGESAEDIAIAEMVQFVEWQPHIAFAYAVTYRSTRGGLYQVNVSPGCGIELAFPKQLGPMEGRLIYEKQ